MLFAYNCHVHRNVTHLSLLYQINFKLGLQIKLTIAIHVFLLAFVYFYFVFLKHSSFLLLCAAVRTCCEKGLGQMMIQKLHTSRSALVGIYRIIAKLRAWQCLHMNTKECLDNLRITQRYRSKLTERMSKY